MTQTNPYIERTDAFMAHLADAGYEVYRVGGSVRDEILDRYIKDADYMVRGCDLKELGDALRLAASRETKGAVAPLKLRDGRQAGWRVSARGLGAIEVTLPRKEVSTGPRHTDFIIDLDPELTLEQDAERRDFTFNALYSPLGEYGDGRLSLVVAGRAISRVIDPTGRGLYDLQHKLINTTHPDSFRDDPLRTLRALRFVSTLGYDLGTETHKQMIEHAKCVDGLTATGNLSGTVYAEMCKLLMGPNVGKALRLARDTGVLGTLFPELVPMLGHEANSRYHDMTTDEHTFLALETAAKVDAPLEVRWALLFHDSGKPIMEWTGTDGRKHYYAYSGPDPDATDAMREDHQVVGARQWMTAAKRLSGIPKDMRNKVERIILEHMVTIQPKNVHVKVRRARVRLGDEMLRWVLLHRMCDLTGKGPAKINQRGVEMIGTQEIIRQAAERDGVPCSVKDLEIDGYVVMDALRNAQARKGTNNVGKVLAAVLDEVICDPSEQKLTREWQQSAAERHAQKIASSS